MKKLHPIKKIIDEGEHQQLDFKFEISDAHKISKSIVAFANTNGGKLLIGVNDDGSIAGIREEEELFMVQSAIGKYISPKVQFTSKDWNINGKVILEIYIPESDDKPHYSIRENGNKNSYIRYQDQNILADPIWIAAMEKKKSKLGTVITYGHIEKDILSYLEKYKKIKLGGVMELCNINQKKAIQIISDFIALDIIASKYDHGTYHYILNDRPTT